MLKDVGRETIEYIIEHCCYFLGMLLGIALQMLTDVEGMFAPTSGGNMLPRNLGKQ
jgi:hypothetical protein